MKVKVYACNEFEMNINNELLDAIYAIHQKKGYATSEQYEEAAKIVEKLTGLPVDDHDDEGHLHIYAVYNADTDIPILEF